MAQYYDRYSRFRDGQYMHPIPGIEVPPAATDKPFIYKKGQTRLDKLSDKYYNNPYSGWLIMQANPEFGGLEFLIPDMTSIRIPFPFDSAIARYTTEVDNHIKLYGK